ncbi:hypothetical protein [Planctomyces sp. SH-PL14]|uniref:hypothetical protein n=1 Tax=Planctomyces sp. SH-PL14 TaxID=1632864 RepID=UPI00078CACAA|nr:hypothetical protein [Planctomyces sp. SH-PL14]AMV18891.1 hypothetical protein VT03_13460 [Planctomyces sp. SH-PL14]
MSLLTPDNRAFMARAVRRLFLGSLHSGPPSSHAEWKAWYADRKRTVVRQYAFGPAERDGMIGPEYSMVSSCILQGDWPDRMDHWSWPDE